MSKILPPEAGLEVQGIFHKYTITKESSADATVSIVNKNATGSGNIYERHDNWNQLPSNTKIGFDVVTPSLGTRWGDGSIGVTATSKCNSDVVTVVVASVVELGSKTQPIRKLRWFID